MPAKGVSEGFKNRNVTVGHAWSAYNQDQQTVFSPKYFERLARASLGLLPPTSSNNNLHPEDETPDPTPDLLTAEELAKYLPIFKELVNTSKLARDFKDGNLVRHSGSQTTREKVMKGEIKKIVRHVSSSLPIPQSFITPPSASFSDPQPVRKPQT